MKADDLLVFTALMSHVLNIINVYDHSYTVSMTCKRLHEV